MFVYIFFLVELLRKNNGGVTETNGCIGMRFVEDVWCVEFECWLMVNFVGF